MKQLIDDLDNIPEQFTDSYRGIILIRRNKDGEVGNAQRKAIKRVTENTKEWKAAILELRDMQQNTHQGYRIYSSVNARDIVKAIHEFKRRQLEVDFGNLYENHKFYQDIENRFFSCMMNPNSRAQNHFIIDCDTIGEYQFAEAQLRNSGLVLMQYPTKTGWHIITNPFNPNDYGTMQIKKDEIMFIG